MTIGKNFVADLPLRRAGQQLARWRAEAGLTGIEAGQLVGFSQTKLSKLENAVQVIDPDDVIALGIAYRVPADERNRVARLARSSVHHRSLEEPAHGPVGADLLRARRREYFDWEAQARSLRSYHLDTMPSVLATAEYAAAAALGSGAHTSGVIAREQAEARARQARSTLHRVHVHVVLDEAALRLLMGGRRVLRDQLLHLIELTYLPTVTVRVIPFRAAAAPATTSFELLRFAEPRFPDLVYLEGLSGAQVLDGQKETEFYRRLFSSMWSDALPPAKSVELIAARAGEL